MNLKSNIIESNVLQKVLIRLERFLSCVALSFLNPELFRKVRRFRRCNKGVQLQINEMLLIARTIRQFSKCRFLVFGVGNDSPFWWEINKMGRTVFLEDDVQWFNQIMKKYPQLEAYLVRYPCQITEWKEVLARPDRLTFNLPESVKKEKWDVILVDAPSGFKMIVGEAGRMSSIYMSSRLVAGEGFIFVHDAEREVERAYCSKYLKNDNLVRQIKGRAFLAQYAAPEF